MKDKFEMKEKLLLSLKSRDSCSPKHCVQTNGNGQRALKLKGYVGFDKIASQLVNKSNKDGYSFNILCIGKLRDE